MAVRLRNPYAVKNGRWWKGNLHTHTTRSDGTREPQVVVDDYRRRGYDFLMISDHDKITPTRGLQSGRMRLIPGNEISARGPHMLHINTRTFIEPTADRQQAIDAARKAGGLVVLNHPNWQEHYNHCPLETLQTLTGYCGIEIYNGVCDRLDGSAYALDKWDRIQRADRPVWGFANDDSHRDGDVELGWNMVLAKQCTPAAIVAALQAGRFYASTGVVIRSIAVKGSKVTVKTANADRLAVYGGLGRLLARVDGRNITFDATVAADARVPFIRIECYGAGGRTAWTQPFFIFGGPSDQRAKLQKQRPVLNVKQVPALPATTALDHATWKKAWSHSGFLDLKTAKRAAVETHLQLLTDGRQLLVRCRCDEPAMAKIKAAVRKNGDPSLWTDDSVELFLDVDGAGKQYWHLMVNTLGHWYAGHSKGQQQLRRVQTAVERDERGWTVVIALPIAELGGVKNLNRWRINVGRSRAGAAGGTSTWKWVGESFHTPEHFGHLKVR